MSRLNIISEEADRELDLIRKTVDELESAVDLADVLGILQGRASLGARVDVLDLIGHSRSPGFLMIGSWTIDDSPQTAASFSLLLRPLLAELGICTIRFLGCSTAATQPARSAIHRVANAARCTVLGTRRYLSRNDYGPAGFKSTETLIGGDGAAAPR